MKNRTFITVLLVAIVCIAALFTVTALADGAVDPSHPASLTVSYQYNGKAIPNVEFYVFKVADVSADGSFTLAGDFAGFSGSVNGLNSADEWNKLATELEQYASAKSLKPAYTGTTGNDGKVQFPAKGEAMMPGLYLMTCGNTKIDNEVYTSQPSVISLPSEEDGNWQYDVAVNAKCGHTPVPTTPPVVTPPPEKLPQTGMLWWPVPVLVLAGLFALAIGVVVRRREA